MRTNFYMDVSSLILGIKVNYWTKFIDVHSIMSKLTNSTAHIRIIEFAIESLVH